VFNVWFQVAGYLSLDNLPAVNSSYIHFVSVTLCIVQVTFRIMLWRQKSPSVTAVVAANPTFDDFFAIPRTE
jgi:hypothetical protein